jgi:hypothetical protein
MAAANQPVPMAALKSAWKSAQPSRKDFGAVVAELQSSLMVGEGNVFGRGNHVPVTHLAFFKPPATAFLSELKARDRRSAKEWEYVNCAGVWLEMGQAALTIERKERSIFQR